MTMTPDEMRAESEKYSDRAVIIVPLWDDWFAVFNNRRQLQAMVKGEGLVSAVLSVQCAPRDGEGVMLPTPVNLKDLGL